MRRAPQELATSLSAWCIASLDAKRSVFCITYHAVPFHLSYLSAKPSTRAVGVVSVGIPREGWRRMYDVEAMEILAQGAEGKVYRTQFLGRPAIVKQRFKKAYRHPTLDEKLAKQRCRSEVACIARARKMGVRAPTVYYTDMSRYCIFMEHVQGRSVKDLLFSQALEGQALDSVLSQIGVAVATLHDGNLVHGDLTTSNILVRDSDSKVVVIDFGLAFTSTVVEDKAVDLYVLERAISSAHDGDTAMFQKILSAYGRHSKRGGVIINRFKEVRLRGRKRPMVG